MKYELIHIALALAIKLARNYAEVEPHTVLHRKYTKAIKQLSEVSRINALSNTYYTDALITIHNRISYTKGIINKLEDYTAQLAGLSKTAEGLTQYYTLEAIKFFAYTDYARVALTCKIALEELEQNQAATSSQKIKFLFLGAVAAIAAKRFEIAENYLLQVQDFNTVSHLNWQVTMYYRVVCAFHEKKFYKAQELYDKATKRQQHKALTEHWAILHAYLSILNNRRFRLGKFFNETFEASLDKAGLNIHILIADLLVSLKQNRDRFLHRIDAIRSYSYRHLRGQATERARFFLDFLFLIPRCDFERERLDQASRHIQEKLQRRSIYASHNLEIEIVPFEFLVELVLNKMKVKRRRGRV
ncbi:MAG: hypothetical protein AAGG75_26860 [Bacteroidota bacterium]